MSDVYRAFGRIIAARPDRTRTPGMRLAAVFLTFGSVAALGLSACGSSGAHGGGDSGHSSSGGSAKLSKSTVSLIDVTPSANTIGEYVAVDQGYDKAVGLTVNITPAASAGAAVPAVAAGKTDITWSTIASVASVVAAGGKTQIIMPTTNGIDEQLVFHTSVAKRLGITGTSISDLDKLRGSKITIGVTRPGGGIQKAVQFALDAEGLKAGTDYKFENFQDVNEMAANYNSGKVDAFSGISPQIFQVKEGVRLNYGALSSAYKGASAQVQMASASLINDHPDTVQAYVSATWKGLQYAANPANRAHVLELLMKYTGMTQVEADETWNDFLPLLPTDPCVTSASFAQGMKMANNGMPKPIDVTYEQMVDSTFCTKAKETS